MNTILAMIKREYLVRVRKKSFIIGTLLTPVFWLVILTLPALLLTVGGGDRQVTVLDQSGDPALFQAIQNAAKSLDTKGTTFNLKDEIVPPEQDVDNIRLLYNKDLEKDGSRAYVVLRKEVMSGAGAEYYGSNVTDTSIASLGEAIRAAITERRLVRAGLDPEAVRQYTNQAALKTFKVSAQGESVDRGQAFISSIVVLLATVLTVFGHSAAVLNSVVEEKQSRIVEVLITSVEPVQIMTSKLVGVGILGLTQFAIWGLFALIGAGIGKGLSPGLGIDLSKIGSVLGYCVVFYLLGYFLFASFYLIAGAIASTPEEAGHLSLPVTLLALLPMMIVWVALKDPDGNLAVVLSMIPILTPTVMLMRVAVGTTPFWQILLSIGLMLGSITIAVWAAAKIYRATIMMYGKRVTLAEIGKVLRSS
jgi:ABC-2 type transport system permease protein